VSAPYVQTVDGPVDPAALGVTLTHEHVFLELWASDGQSGMLQLRDEDVLTSELSRFREAGGDCLVDQTPGGAGRDPLGLKRVSARTGVKIVTGCGWYTEPYYPAAADLARRSAASIADELVCEIRDGFGGRSTTSRPRSCARSGRAWTERACGRG
jgi:predicted metal-dependent phosphotriesterase family hydrolase